MSEIDFSADAEGSVPVTQDKLQRVAALSHQLVVAIKAVDAAEVVLKEAKATQRKLEENDLPELMRELGITDLKLADGSAVKVVEEVQCSITEANRPRAHKWLVEHGFGGLIKTNVTVAFARDEREEAVNCAKQISEVTGREAELNESVHAATLKSFVKEQRAAGNPLPDLLFGIFPYSKAKITAPKK